MAQRRRIYHSHEYQHHGPVGLTAAYLKAGPVPVWGGSPRVWFLVQYNNFTFARMGIPFSGEHNPSMRRPISSTILKPGTWLLILHGAALWSRYLKASQQTICLPEAHQSLRGPPGWSCRLVSVHVVLGLSLGLTFSRSPNRQDCTFSQSYQKTRYETTWRRSFGCGWGSCQQPTSGIYQKQKWHIGPYSGSIAFAAIWYLGQPPNGFYLSPWNLSNSKIKLALFGEFYYQSVFGSWLDYLQFINY